MSFSIQMQVIEMGWEQRLRNTGIAGMRQGATIKCLHTHYAHYLARGNDSLIGSWVQQLLDGSLPG
jgi:hypothetical protein